MPAKKYRVKLSKDQREKLRKSTSCGTISARTFKRARVLLLADEAHEKGSKTDEEIAEQVDTSISTVGRVRRRFAEEGLEAALIEKPRPGKPRTFHGKQRAAVTALASSDPPEGRGRWTLRLLADKLVELNIVESISHKTVGEILKKTNSSPTSKGNGV